MTNLDTVLATTSSFDERLVWTGKKQRNQFLVMKSSGEIFSTNQFKISGKSRQFMNLTKLNYGWACVFVCFTFFPRRIRF